MCTAINENKIFHLFGRTLDLEYSYNENVVICPRRFQFQFIHEGKIYEHYAIIGTAHIADGIPLYYDGMNEKGLCVAALRFSELAYYHEKKPEGRNLASFELIPWILCNCESTTEAQKLLKEINVTPESFSEKLPSTPLHWLIGDKERSIVVESVREDFKIYNAPHGVLTNAPDFPTQCRILEKHGDGGEPILGDLSSTSRFIRAVHAKTYTIPTEERTPAISRFFHLMSTVTQPHGLFRADEKQLRTVYTSCMDTERLTYYFTTYDCRKIRGVRMKNAHLDLDTITEFPMKRKEWIHFLN